ncbi:MAG: MBL fold metallo-hydrolase [Saccharofermentanaceae bacterium]|jgi:ribonuclease BN (tRNA processing enzyme)|nr:MBL fold metallo-hydrolase [Clostridia bacterium]NLX67957.1 MBL fold metallo-hydrolase [Clostridiaceae bacterium]HOO48421.1 MBL fold metallo-hydrolase [Saccharofermentans sp.]HPE28352.1 MBL fold metallo-hydrolase [Saccharofermentans sp.]HPJ81316.1 MBL fold metallo-hydrolase [Saccharofermentans sp.]
MKITLIGTSGGYQSSSRACTSYLIQEEGKNIVVDLGPGSLANLQKYIKICEIDAIFLTHYHYDHCSDLLPLIYAVSMQKSSGYQIKPITLYCQNIDSSLSRLICESGSFIPIYIDSTSIIDAFGLMVSFAYTKHAIPCLSMRFAGKDGKVFSFTGDCAYGCDEIGPIIDGSDLAIFDCGELDSSTALIKNHMTPSNCFQLCKNHNVRKAILSHIIPHYDIETYEYEASQFKDWNYIIAYDGYTIDL